MYARVLRQSLNIFNTYIYHCIQIFVNVFFLSFIGNQVTFFKCACSVYHANRCRLSCQSSSLWWMSFSSSWAWSTSRWRLASVSSWCCRAFRSTSSALHGPTNQRHLTEKWVRWSLCTYAYESYVFSSRVMPWCMHAEDLTTIICSVDIRNVHGAHTESDAVTASRQRLN